MLKNDGDTFTKLAETFRTFAQDGEQVLASVYIGFTFWLLTNRQLVCLNLMETKIKTSHPLSQIDNVRLETNKLGQKIFYLKNKGQKEAKLGEIKEIAEEFLELFESTFENLPQSASEAIPSLGVGNSDASEVVEVDPKVRKQLKAEQKKAERAEAKEKKKEAERVRKAEEKANYGREVLSEMVGLKTVKFYEKGFVKVGMLGDFEKLTGIEGSADNLQKKSAAGRTAGFVFTGGLNMLGSNKRGDLLITITTTETVHTLHVDAPYEHDLKSHHRIVSVGKSLLESSKSQENQSTTAPAQSMSDEIVKLSALKDAGVLTEEEFTEAKKRLLGG